LQVVSWTRKVTIHLSRALEIATALAAAHDRPYGAEVLDLCWAAEQVLVEHLKQEPQWSAYAWLDGFVPSLVDRAPDRVVVRGEVWIGALGQSAQRTEPCEFEIRLPGSGRAPTATIRFATPGGPEGAHRHRKPKFPIRDWVYVFEVA
jgi:hypothetical protein